MLWTSIYKGGGSLAEHISETHKSQKVFIFWIIQIILVIHLGNNSRQKPARRFAQRTEKTKSGTWLQNMGRVAIRTRNCQRNNLAN